MSGLKSHVTFTPPEIEQLVYVDEPLTIFAFAVVALAFSVKVIESMSVGVVALSVYATPETVYPLIVPLPEPALDPGTVFVAVKAYMPVPSAAATTSTPMSRARPMNARVMVPDLSLGLGERRPSAVPGRRIACSGNLIVRSG
jgi:hypothetical protein